MNIDRCTADFMDCTVDCELPAGHEGDHEGTVSWPQSDFVPLLTGPLVMGGYLEYLKHRYA